MLICSTSWNVLVRSLHTWHGFFSAEIARERRGMRMRLLIDISQPGLMQANINTTYC